MIDKTSIKFFKIGFTSIEAMSDSFSFKFNGLVQIWPSYQPDSSYSTLSEVNLLNTWFQPRYSLIEIKRGIDKLLKKLNNMYFKVDVLKYILPDEMMRNKTKLPIQNLVNTKISDFFDLGQEKMIDFDNSINSFVGCCSLGTGHSYSFIKWQLRKF